MNTQRQIETAPKRQSPKLVADHAYDELLLARHELAWTIANAKTAISAVTVSRKRAEASGDQAALARAALESRRELLAAFDLVHSLKMALIKKAVDRRLSQVSHCEFQMMVDGVPYYHFSDHGTGTRFESIAYGTEANRVMYQLKADLARAVTLSTSRELDWVSETLDGWKKALAA